MRHALKSALLSGLVLPGLGQMALRRYLRGAIFMIACLGGLIAIMVKATTTALVIVERMGPATNITDFNQMFSETNQAVAQVDSTGYALALMLIVLAWIASTVDAYFLGRRRDQKEEIDRESKEISG